MRQFDRHPLTAGGVGVIIAVLLSIVAPPTLALGTGAVAVVAVVLSVDGYRQYAWAGTVFVLLSAPLFVLFPTASSAYEQTVFLSLVGFGLASLFVLFARVGIRFATHRALYRVSDEDAREHASQTTAGIVGTLMAAWSVIAAKERIARSGVVGALAPVTALFDVAGISVEIPGFWILTGGIDLVVVTFVGTVVVAFHTLSSWHAFFHLSKTETAQAVGRKTKETASNTAEKSRDIAGKSRQQLDETVDSVDSDDITTTAKETSRTLVDDSREKLDDTVDTVRSEDLAETAREQSNQLTDRARGRLSGIRSEDTGRAGERDDEHQQSGTPSGDEPAQSPPRPTQYCTDCGTELGPNTQVCPACGRPVDSVSGP